MRRIWPANPMSRIVTWILWIIRHLPVMNPLTGRRFRAWLITRGGSQRSFNGTESRAVRIQYLGAVRALAVQIWMEDAV
jgi:hypothetical protein